MVGPFEQQVEKAFAESHINETLSPPMAKRAGFNYIVVPSKDKFPSYGPRGFADSDEAYEHGQKNFPRGFTLMTLDEYTRAWRDGLI